MLEAGSEETAYHEGSCREMAEVRRECQLQRQFYSPVGTLLILTFSLVPFSTFETVLPRAKPEASLETILQRPISQAIQPRSKLEVPRQVTPIYDASPSESVSRVYHSRCSRGYDSTWTQNVLLWIVLISFFVLNLSTRMPLVCMDTTIV